MVRRHCERDNRCNCRQLFSIVVIKLADQQQGHRHTWGDMQLPRDRRGKAPSKSFSHEWGPTNRLHTITPSNLKFFSASKCKFFYMRLGTPLRYVTKHYFTVKKVLHIHTYRLTTLKTQSKLKTLYTSGVIIIIIIKRQFVRRRDSDSKSRVCKGAVHAGPLL